MSSGKITSSADSSGKGSPRTNAIRERSRVQSLRDAFQSLQLALPAVPPSTKLSKLDVLLMASAYIAHLGRLVESDDDTDNSNETTTVAQESASVFAHIHPVKKWPMRARFYYGLDLSSKSHQKSPGCPYNRPTHIRSSSLN